MDYLQLAQYTASIEGEYPDEGAPFWEGSEFAWIRKLPAATKHTVGVRLVMKLLNEGGVTTQKCGRGLKFGNAKIGVKFSMEWVAGDFVFEQFKKTDPEFTICFGISPENAYGWLVPKGAIIVDGVWQEKDGLSGQHSGAAADDTRWLSISPSNPPSWLPYYGGNIQAFQKAAKKVLQGI